MSQEKNKGGRPSLLTEELIDSIVARLSGGEPLAQICRDDGMPSPRTVRSWISSHPDVSAAIAGAREDGEDWLAAECLLIADTPKLGVIEEYERQVTEGEDGQKREKLVLVKRREEDMLGHRKLQIETRLKLLAKWNPRKYGDKLDVQGHLTLEQLVAAAAGTNGAEGRNEDGSDTD